MVETRGVDLYDESYFRKWYRDWSQRSGISNDPDHKDAKYDYRAAWKARKPPVWNEELKKYEWLPEFSYEQPENPPQRYELALTINGIRLEPVAKEAPDGVPAS